MTHLATLRSFDMSFRHPSADIACPSCLAQKIELAFQDHNNTICRALKILWRCCGCAKMSLQILQLPFQDSTSIISFFLTILCSGIAYHGSGIYNSCFKSSWHALHYKRFSFDKPRRLHNHDCPPAFLLSITNAHDFLASRASSHPFQ